LDPTSVYSPGGLVGPPGGVRDDTSRAPGHEFDTAAPVAPPTVDAEYAEVVHEERPEPPRHLPPRDVPLMPVATPEAFVYRDTDNPDGSAGEGDSGGSGGSAVHSAPRGPFEPLVRSADTDGDRPG